MQQSPTSMLDLFRQAEYDSDLPGLGADDGIACEEPGELIFRAIPSRWLNHEQYSHEPNIATPRFWATHGVKMTGELLALLERKRELGHAALGVMESHLSEKGFFVGDRYTVADIALYAYTHVAHEGGFELGPYPAVRAWIGRVASQPGHVAITEG